MNKKQAGRLVGWIGAVLTVAYLVVLVWLLEGRLASLKAMPLNEVGDFLAGAFGPLAILWLVLGFFQQGIELRQNSAALELQAQELHNSVAQQAELVRVAREQLESDRQALEQERNRHNQEQKERWARSQPRFTFSVGGNHGSHGSNHELTITNSGATCTDLHITAIGIESNFVPQNRTILEQGSRATVGLYLALDPVVKEFDVVISFRDALSDPQRQLFRCVVVFRRGNFYGELLLSPITEPTLPAQEPSEAK